MLKYTHRRAGGVTVKKNADVSGQMNESMKEFTLVPAQATEWEMPAQGQHLRFLSYHS